MRSVVTPQLPQVAPVPRGDGRGPRYGSASAACPHCFPPGAGGEGAGLTPIVPPDVRFVTEESFDFGVLSPSDRYGGAGSGDRAPRGWEQGGQGTF